jgi:hypothetical protein
LSIQNKKSKEKQHEQMQFQVLILKTLIEHQKQEIEKKQQNLTRQ